MILGHGLLKQRRSSGTPLAVEKENLARPAHAVGCAGRPTTTELEEMHTVARPEPAIR